MAFLNRNKVVSGGAIERRHINLLRICISVSVILAFAVIVLQVLALFFPPVQEEIGLAFGAARRSFRLTPVSAAAFLSIPAIAIVLIWVYLKGYFKRNTHGSHLRIPYLDKHPRKKTAKYFHYAFIAVMLLASAVLGVINFIKVGRIDPHTRWDQLMALIPVLVMVFVLVGFYLHTVLMRKRKRIYSHHSHHHNQNTVDIDSVEEVTEPSSPEADAVSDEQKPEEP